MIRKELPMRIRIILILCILAAGIFLRFWNLGIPSFWVDEVNTVYAAKGIIETGKPELPSGMVYNRGILYTTLVSLIYRANGISESTTRTVSALFGILSIGLIGVIGRRLFNGRIGLMSSFLLAFSHFAVGWSRTARPYTLLQFLTLFIIYAFLRGFETRPGREQPLYSRMPFWKRNALSPVWLLVFFALTAITYLTVHRLTIFIPAGILVYVLIKAVTTGINVKSWWNKYTIASLITAGGVVFLFIFPFVREETTYFLTYVPPWAEGAFSGNRLTLFLYLINEVKFPLAFLFFMGSAQLFTRESQSGWLLFWTFTIPLLLLSFVFQYRVPAYLFYVYPFFLILAAAGFIRLVNCEIGIMDRSVNYPRKWMRSVYTLLLFSIFIISPWARITINIPFLEDGKTNLAVHHNEWREAAEMIKEKRTVDDIIVVDLPLMMDYYELKADYNLNWANLGRARMNESMTDGGQYVEVYAGTPCIESLEVLKVLTSGSRGWIVVSAYHLDQSNYIPEEVRTYLLTLEQRITKNNTVHVFRWNNQEQA